MEEYKLKVYKLLTKVPKGKVVTYGQVAKFLGMKSPRLVGRILHFNKDPKNIPCHRVVFADGKLSSNYAFGGMRKQKEKLSKEGVLFIHNKVNLEKHLLSLI